jgi:hypothetical protein
VTNHIGFLLLRRVNPPLQHLQQCGTVEKLIRVESVNRGANVPVYSSSISTAIRQLFVNNMLCSRIIDMEHCVQVAAAEGEAKVAREALADASNRSRWSPADYSANTEAIEEVALLRETNAELQNRASYLEEQLIQRDRLLESMPQHSPHWGTPKVSTGATNACVFLIIHSSHVRY